MCWTVVTDEMLLYRLAKLPSAPNQTLQPVVGQGQDDHVEQMILEPSLISSPQPVDAVRVPGDGNDGTSKAHFRRDAFLERDDKPLDPPNDRVQAKVTGIVHEHVLQSVERAWSGEARWPSRSEPRLRCIYGRSRPVCRRGRRRKSCLPRHAGCRHADDPRSIRPESTTRGSARWKNRICRNVSSPKC